MRPDYVRASFFVCENFVLVNAEKTPGGMVRSSGQKRLAEQEFIDIKEFMGRFVLANRGEAHPVVVYFFGFQR